VNDLIYPDADSGEITGMQNQTAILMDELVSPIAAAKRACKASRLSNRNIKGPTALAVLSMHYLLWLFFFTPISGYKPREQHCLWGSLG
jgi:hypothetical protein